ncbi:MAG: hypothetical protein ACRD1K_20900, partial [Acidimicrobiales bacterium]
LPTDRRTELIDVALTCASRICAPQSPWLTVPTPEKTTATWPPPGHDPPVEEPPSRVAELREQLSWVAVPMGKCSEPTNVRAGGQACPIRYQCAGCPHFESDPSYLPDLRAYADDLRREREVLLGLGAASWVVDNVAGQLGVIVEHVRRHEHMLEGLSAEQRDAIEDASRTVRKARQSVPVAFGRRQREAGDG